MIPSVVKQLSRTRSRVFKPVVDYNDKDCWLKAQKFQDHIYETGTDFYVFVNYQYFTQAVERITKVNIERHINAFKSKSYSEFVKRRMFYMFDYKDLTCECRLLGLFLL